MHTTSYLVFLYHRLQWGSRLLRQKQCRFVLHQRLFWVVRFQGGYFILFIEERKIRIQGTLHTHRKTESATHVQVYLACLTYSNCI